MCPWMEKQIEHSVFIVLSQPSVRHIVCVCVCDRWATALSAATSAHRLYLGFIYSIICQYPKPHLNSADYALLLNDRSWGLQIQKPFGWLGPLGLAIHHKQHPPISTCKAEAGPNEHKSLGNELKGCFLCDRLFPCALFVYLLEKGLFQCMCVRTCSKRRRGGGALPESWRFLGHWRWDGAQPSRSDSLSEARAARHLPQRPPPASLTSELSLREKRNAEQSKCEGIRKLE